MRIISLIASSTEIICALGFESWLVGRSHECDYPPSVKQLPVCTEPKFQVEGTSREIDERVKQILRDGLSVYRVFPEKLAELKPDVIVTQTHCEVCAVSLKDVEAAVCELVPSSGAHPPKIISLHPNSLEDIWADIQRVADGLGAPEKGEALVKNLRDRMSKVEAATRGSGGPGPRVAYIEWLDPLMAGGNWMPTLVRMAGGVNLFGEEGKHSPFFSWEELRASDPDVLFISPCGFDIARTRQEMPALLKQDGWKKLKAVRENKVFLADGNQFFNRPGPRVADSLEIVASALQGRACEGLEFFSQVYKIV
jgi:iron complex transport system substrate-binding protein